MRVAKENGLDYDLWDPSRDKFIFKQYSANSLEDKYINKRRLQKECKLTKDESGTYTTTIVDAELDGVECTFHNDNCVMINSEGYEYVTLSKGTLLDLVNLIDEAADLYSPFDGSLDEE